MGKVRDWEDSSAIQRYQKDKAAAWQKAQFDQHQMDKYERVAQAQSDHNEYLRALREKAQAVRQMAQEYDHPIF